MKTITIPINIWYDYYDDGYVPEVKNKKHISMLKIMNYQ